MNYLPSLSVIAAAVALAGCTALLPRATSVSPSSFGSYAEAQRAAERVVPFRTGVRELPALGFDAQDGRNVTLIPYPDIVARLAPYSGVPLGELDAGVRACIQARTACRGYLFKFGQEARRREGNFLTDFLNLQRVTHVTGWRFEALLVVSDDTVLFRNYAGDAHVERVDKQTNPLGPFQQAGEGAGSLLLD